ncbi:MAG: HlyC/CorC family transporter [Aestuariivirga sp.]|uniref:hemolysin family protein n=1 Tax=Aestuariivirga sp. TaxID=2650926 RepID=UPI0025C464DD|nr:hemolysin family protein [Aestuariivirga sp.]MCA3560414.1 HlyC/CorC family transporter [Aestuariivirga sp.]
MFALEILLVLALVALNGLLAMSELAIVSSRTGRLKSMSDRGVKGARAALQLAENPGRFLSTVQVGISLVGILAGAFSGATLGDRLAGVLEGYGVPHNYAGPIGFTLVVTIITYISVIIGELVPKQLALQHPEAIACRVAYPMDLLSRIAGPFVWLLDGSGRALIRLLRLKESSEAGVTDEEIKSLIAEAESAGVIESGERDMIAGVMRLGDRPVRALMTPMTDIDMIGIDDGPSDLKKKIVATPHSRIPVHGEDADEVIGIVVIKDVVDALLERRKLEIGKLVQKAPVIPESMPALEAMELFRGSSIHVAFVQDEYGRTLGLVTAADLLSAIAGSLEPADEGGDRAFQRDDGSWLLPGDMAVDEMAELIGFALPPKRRYETVAGLVIDAFKHLPSLGQAVKLGSWRFEVVDLDGRRVDKVLASRAAETHRPARRTTSA